MRLSTSLRYRDRWRRHAAEGWIPDGCGVAGAGGDLDDDQVSDSFSVRLRNEAIPGAVIDLIFYVVAPEGADGFDQDRDDYTAGMTAEWIICDDPDEAVRTATWHVSAGWSLPDTLDFHTCSRWVIQTSDCLNDGRWDVAGVSAAFSPDDEGGALAQAILGWDGQPFELPDDGAEEG
jgi:hypothetical protein